MAAMELRQTLYLYAGLVLNDDFQRHPTILRKNNMKFFNMFQNVLYMKLNITAVLCEYRTGAAPRICSKLKCCTVRDSYSIDSYLFV
jgi:hypothetical protein